jgi:RNA polymerase sigma factor (sigma-70 family)
MPTSVIEHIRRVVGDGVGLRDGELLGRYVDRRDETALAALVNRHGPMVWGVCRRHLSHHDAEDAFQATFIVLVRKAASIAQREAVGNWLYGVAHQTALQARRSAARRRAREVQVAEMPDAEAPQERWADLQPLLDEELSRLPDHYRTVIVLSDLEGRTRKEVAAQLGCPEGTVGSRLVRARSMLANRLTQRGVAMSGGALAVVLSQSTGSAGVPAAVVSSTIKAASLCAAGNAMMPVKVAALAEGVMKAMLFNKLKAAMAVVLVLGFVATGATILTDRTAAGQDDRKPVAEKPVEPAVKQEKEAFTAWGKEAGGLQAGLGFRPGEKRAYHHGETVKLVVRVRNVGKEPVKFEYLKEFFMETPPTATDSQGKPVFSRLDGELGAIHLPVEVTLAAGKEIELYELKPELKPASDNAPNGTSVLHGTGTFQLQYDPVFGNSSLGGIKVDPTLSKLATGKLELEIKSDPPPASKNNLPDKKVKESFTAWGKEINGLQAGVGFPAGQKRTYSHGETVTLVVRIRNVGKEEVTFQYVPAFFQETPPTVKHGTGEPVLPIRCVSAPGRTHPATAVTIAPGKEVELYEWNARLANDPVAGGADDRGVIYHRGTGKLSVQYERVLGNSSASRIKTDPALSKLATGKLDLEIKSAEKK